MTYTTKKYLKELKTNPYWEVEPHFFDWAMFKHFEYFETIVKNEMTAKDFQSAMYGEFVIEGKPILKGFIKRLNCTLNFLIKIIEKNV